MEGALSPETRMHKNLLEVWASQRPVHVGGCAPGVGGRIPRKSLGCLVCSSLCIGPSCSGNTTAPTGPKTLKSEAKAKASGMVGGEADYGLSKVDLC